MATPKRQKEIADTPLAQWLDSELTERGWGIRTLARRMTPSDPEIARRTLNRAIFEGSDPTDENRDLIAAGLNVDPSEVPANAGPFPAGAAA